MDVSTKHSLKLLLATVLTAAVLCPAQRQMENLSRGTVAIKQPDKSVYIGWRLFGTDPDSIAFNVYRTTGSDMPVKKSTKNLSRTPRTMRTMKLIRIKFCITASLLWQTARNWLCVKR